MLRAYCLELQRDWDEGVPLLLFAVREVVQESLGFSPAELVFGHTVRGPLQVLKEKWLFDVSTPCNLLDYVCKFRYRLTKACELASANLQASQKRMKVWYDQKARSRSFVPDTVLVLLPLPGSLHARYSCPYTVVRKVSELDYVIATPDRRKQTRLCHVNMLKEYCSRGRAREQTRDGKPKVPVLPFVLAGAGEVQEELGSRVPERRLNNSESMANLDSQLSHLSIPERTELIALLASHQSLFPDVPSQTTWVVHDIDVGDASPVKQHPYRTSPAKRALLQQEIAYMTEHGIVQIIVKLML